MAKHARRLANTVGHDILRLLPTYDRVLDLRHDRWVRVRDERVVYHGQCNSRREYSVLHRQQDGVEAIRRADDGEEQALRRAESGVETRWTQAADHDPSMSPTVLIRQWSYQHDPDSVLAEFCPGNRDRDPEAAPACLRGKPVG